MSYHGIDDECVKYCDEPTFCYQYAEDGLKISKLPRSAYKRNGLQDNVVSELGAIKYICKSKLKPCCCEEETGRGTKPTAQIRPQVSKEKDCGDNLCSCPETKVHAASTHRNDSVDREYRTQKNQMEKFIVKRNQKDDECSCDRLNKSSRKSSDGHACC